MSTPASPSISFQPRKEFARDDTRSNSFALMAIAGSNLLRLYSFQFSLVSLFRRLLEQRHLLANYREDSVQSFYEFALESKPWTDSKGLNSERFLLEIIAIVYRHGYSYVSTINYGREPDERLAMTFSCPTQLLESQVHLSILPSHTLGAPEMSYDGFTLQTPTNYRVPFALSFTSATTLRVINPPLYATPAILAAVKGSWPRGVDSEKKIGDACYEFKLRGYKWFQADTFATDSLKYILSLLNALDARGFVLLTSVSLSGRSRTKDLWIFTGPPPPAGGIDASISSTYDSFAMQPISVQNSEKGPGADLRRSTTGPTRRVPPPYSARSPFAPALDSQSSAMGGAQSQHQRSATDGSINAHPGGGPYPPPPLPPRPNPNAQTDQQNSSRSSFGSRNVLRKAPRAQVPVSVVSEDLERATLPSVGSSAVNMTGVGTGMAGWHPADQHQPEEREEAQGGGEVIYSTSNYPLDLRYEDERPHSEDDSDHDDGVPEFEQQEDISSNEDGIDSAAEAGPSRLRGFNNYDHDGSPSTQPTSQASPRPSSSHEGSTSTATRPGLLGKGVFAGGGSDFSVFSREYSRNTQGLSRDLGMIPTDVFQGRDESQSARGDDDDREDIDATSGDDPRQPFVRRTSSTPAFPGAWAPSPEKEKEEPAATQPAPVDETPEDTELEGTSSSNAKQASRSPLERQSVQSVEPAHRVKLMSFLGRKSHVGVVGNIEDPAPQVPPVPTVPAGVDANPNDVDGAGWVYIDTSRPGAPSDQKQQEVPQDVGDEDAVKGQTQVDGTAAAAYMDHHENNHSGSVGEDSASSSDEGSSEPICPTPDNNDTMAPGTPVKKAKELDGTGEPGTEGKKRRFFSLKDRSRGHDENGGGSAVAAGSPASPKATRSGFRDRLKKQLG